MLVLALMPGTSERAREQVLLLTTLEVRTMLARGQKGQGLQRMLGEQKAQQRWKVERR